jgi:hypothetical protein
MLPIQMRLCSPVDRGRKRAAPAGPIDRLAQGPTASLRAGRPGSLHTAGADLKPVGLALRVFLLPSARSACRRLSAVRAGLQLLRQRGDVAASITERPEDAAVGQVRNTVWGYSVLCLFERRLRSASLLYGSN